MSDIIDDVATLTSLDGRTVNVILKPYPSYPDAAPKVLRFEGRLFNRTSTFGYGVQGPTTYSEFVPVEPKQACQGPGNTVQSFDK